MFWKRKKNRQKRQLTNFNWLIVGAIVVLMLNYYDGNRLLSRAAGKGESGPANASDTANAVDTFKIPNRLDLETFQQRIFPDPSKRAVTIQDLEPGEGSPALCGQEVSIVFQAYDAKGNMLPDSADSKSPLQFVVGKHQVIPAFEQGIIGLRPNGVRNIFAPPALAYAADGFARDDISTEENIRLEVRLMDAKPSLPAPENSSYRFFDSKRGLGHPTRCGETLPVHITVWSTEGEKLYTSYDVGAKLIDVTPGSGHQFLGLEHAVIDMRPGTARTAVVPPAFQKIWHKDATTLEIPFPENQTVLVDIQAAAKNTKQ